MSGEGSGSVSAQRGVLEEVAALRTTVSQLLDRVNGIASMPEINEVHSVPSHVVVAADAPMNRTGTGAGPSAAVPQTGLLSQQAVMGGNPANVAGGDVAHPVPLGAAMVAPGAPVGNAHASAAAAEPIVRVNLRIEPQVRDAVVPDTRVPAVVVAPPAGAVPMDVEVPAAAAAPVVAQSELETRLAALEQRERERMQVGKPDGQTQRMPTRVSIPTLAVWDGKLPGRKAETFLNDVAWYAEQSGHAAMQLLPRALAPDGVRSNWEAVCARFALKGKEMTWQDARHEFKQMVGESEERIEDAAIQAFIDGCVKMSEGQTVAAYRTTLKTSCASLLPSMKRLLYSTL